MPGSPKGKKKLSKAEKEKLKKEEAERKLQEEEAARVKAEKDEVERKAREKEEAEERRRLENEERKRRKGELQELDQMYETQITTLQTERSERRLQAKWQRYVLCDGSPDPTVAPEINTYINLWREDMDHNDIHSVLKGCGNTMALINELEHVLRETPGQDITEREISQYNQTMRDLQQLMQEKLDLASHDLLLQARSLADPETNNLQQVIGNDIITLCMWGNLSKNPRIKSHEFEKIGFTVELPKLLTLADCAVRVLWVKVDYLSERSKSYTVRVKPRAVPDLLRHPFESREPAVSQTRSKNPGKGRRANQTKTPAAKKAEKEPTVLNTLEETEEETQEKADISREETKDVLAALDEAGQDDELQDDEEKPDKEQKEPDPDMEEDYEIKTPEPLEYEDFDGDDDTLDLRAYHTVGGIFHFNLLHLPPQPKIANDWLITQVVDTELRLMEYLADAANTARESSARDDDSEPQERRREERPPISVTVRLPEDVFFCEEPQVVRWHDGLDQWRLEGFTDHTFNEETRMFSFKTSHFGTMALVQDAHINMPFQSWTLRPRGLNHAHLTIIAAITEVEIEIKDDKCCLVQPEDRPELKHILQRWTSVHELVQNLKRTGINLFPAVDSSKYVSIQNKNQVTEERLYQQLALMASSMAFSWSRWNSEVNDGEKIVIQWTERLEDDPPLETDWSLMLVTKKRTTLLKMSEYDEVFSDDHREGTEFHADVYHMAMEKNNLSEEGRRRVADTSHQFVDAVKTLLSTTKVVTYS